MDRLAQLEEKQRALRERRSASRSKPSSSAPQDPPPPPDSGSVTPDPTPSPSSAPPPAQDIGPLEDRITQLEAKVSELEASNASKADQLSRYPSLIESLMSEVTELKCRVDRRATVDEVRLSFVPHGSQVVSWLIPCCSSLHSVAWHLLRFVTDGGAQEGHGRHETCHCGGS